jgi:hypothetical protein
MPINTKTSIESSRRYFLLTAEMLISEEVTKVLIAENAGDAEDKVEDDLTFQNFSDWDYQGEDIKSAGELANIRELTKQEYDDYIAAHSIKPTSQHSS